MKITDIRLSVFELPTQSPFFNLETETLGNREVWRSRPTRPGPGEYHVLHVFTDDGIEGICTVGDARYTTMRPIDLEHLRHLAIGENPLNRKRLESKLRHATRHVFTMPGWFGAFDNCLWDIAGKVENKPVHQLIGATRDSAPAYYNYRGGGTLEAAIEDIQHALSIGFTAVKDHLSWPVAKNVYWFGEIRRACGDDIDIMHDAAGARYDLEDAIKAGRSLEDHGYRWFEEAIPDRDFNSLRQLCDTLDIPVMALETLMHEPEISKVWLEQGACDLVRAHARHGTTTLLDLAEHAASRNTNVELNGPGGLFGLVHTHLTCAIPNTSYYEYFPGGSRDEIGREIGLLNPPIPQNGQVTPPNRPGWGAVWDTQYFNSIRIAQL